MGKIILSIFIIAVFLLGANSFALSEQVIDQLSGIKSEITGEVTEVKGDTVTIKDEMGKTNTFKLSDSETPERVNVGDTMSINIRKLDSGFVSMFTGKVTDIKDNTLTIQDKTGGTYSFKITDSKALENIKAGDMVSVKVQKHEEMKEVKDTPLPETTPDVTPQPTTTPNPKVTPSP